MLVVLSGQLSREFHGMIVRLLLLQHAVSRVSHPSRLAIRGLKGFSSLHLTLRDAGVLGFLWFSAVCGRYSPAR
jgi:hypothetical protein